MPKGDREYKAWLQTLSCSDHLGLYPVNVISIALSGKMNFFEAHFPILWKAITSNDLIHLSQMLSETTYVKHLGHKVC